MRSEVIFDNGTHKWIVLGRDTEKKAQVIDTNEYIIINNGQAVLLDPGGIEIFPQVLTEMTKFISTDNIKAVIASHQDPDIASSLAMWIDLSPDVKIYSSWIWAGFLAHFGMGTNMTITTIPDEGAIIPIGTTNANVYMVPAHYCHSSGFFTCYDPIADILFTGDIGAALLPADTTDLFVTDFNKHIQYMELFHRRWMPSKDALKDWIRRVRAINPSMLCPQHGSIFRGNDVERFLIWLENLEVSRYEKGPEDEDISQCLWMKWKK